MKIYKLILAAVLLITVWSAKAQQDPMFTQYNRNLFSINPAIAGVKNVHNISMLMRAQWVGMAGAPTTSTISYQTMRNENVGLGAKLIYDQIGPVTQVGIYADYAYRITIDEERDRNLSFGIMGGINHYTFDLISLSSHEPDDDVPVDGLNRKVLPNFGIGLFYYTPKFYFGASVPKLLKNSLSDVNNTLTAANREERHMYAMVGTLIDINEKWQVRPSTIGRIVNGAPASLDFNGTVLFQNEFWFGALYRLGVSVGGFVGWQMNEHLSFSYNYDFYGRQISRYNFGTHELVFSYNIGKKEEIKLIPRYF